MTDKIDLLNREELAWAAGFFDGEGNIRAQGPHSPRNAPEFRRLVIQISQKDTEVLYRFQRAVLGLGGIYGPTYDKRGSGGMYSYRITSWEKGQAIIAMLWPFLSTIKREQAATSLVDVMNYKRTSAYHNGRHKW